MTTEFPDILPAEDNPNRVELTLEALVQHTLADRVTVAKDGVEAIESLGVSWALINERPASDEAKP